MTGVAINGIAIIGFITIGVPNNTGSFILHKLAGNANLLNKRIAARTWKY